jgi:hypothetical protein
MKEEELKRLIEKYYSGESTEDEERTLREFFRRNKYIQGYEAEKVIFSYYAESAEIPEPSHDFEAQILAAIDASDRRKGTLKLKRYLIPLLSTAAGLLILTGSYLFFVNRAEKQDTFSDPELAYAETIKILRNVSSQLNHGALTLEPVSKINVMKNKSLQTMSKSAKIAGRNLGLFQRTMKLTKDGDNNERK